MTFEDVQVICYEGHVSRERPAWVIMKGRKIEITEILDRWYEGAVKPGPPTVRYFRVLLADENVILLRYVPLFDRWAMVKPFQRKAPPPRGRRAKIIPFPHKEQK